MKPRQYIHDALKIGDRPAHIATRAKAGNEGDLIMGKANRSAIVTLVERSSRFLVAFALPAGNRSEAHLTKSSKLGAFPARSALNYFWGLRRACWTCVGGG